jgi:Restriction endonuclease
MAAYSQAQIKKLLNAADTAATNDAKGKILEDLVCYLFEKIPGLTFPQRNVLNRFESEEIDVAFFNEQHPKGLRSFNRFLLIECKNWSGPVGSLEVGAFLSKLRSRGLEFGILIAANGITGKPEDSTAAHQQVTLALAEGRQLIIITRAEIETLKASDELVRMIKTKVCQLIASGTVWP